MNDNFKHFTDSEVIMSQLMLPSHSNFGGKIHGGYILSLMDQIAFACASKHAGKYCVTASVEKVNFLQPIEVGELVTMKAAVNHVGNTSMVVGIRVESEDFIKGVVKHCNSSFFTMVAKERDGSNAQVPGLILRSNNEVRRFVRSIKRKETQNERKYTFDLDGFDPNQFSELIENANARIES